ncbi:MAG TPA: hypothetical protein G4N95_08960, partial [Anaerolineae bacterium]|nr:hypothetical protein [Anaerolineae bacterium]
DYPFCKTLISEITPQNISQIIPALKESAAIDVTGGMYSKVTKMVQLVERNPEVRVSIFSGMEAGAIEQSLSGEFLGTTIYAVKNE